MNHDSKLIFDDITVRELFGQAIKRWRKVFIVALVFAIVAGGYKAFTLRQVSKLYSDQAALESKIAQINLEKVNLNANIAAQEKVIADSVYLNFFSPIVARGQITFYVSSLSDTEKDYAQNVIYAYYLMFQDESLSSDIAEVSNGVYRLENLSQLITFAADFQNDIDLMTIEIKHYDEDSANELLSFVEQAIINEKTSVEESIGDFDIKVVSKNVAIVVDPTVMSAKDAANANLQSFYQSLQNKESELNSILTATTSKTFFVNVLLYLLIGFVIGIVVSIVVLMIVILMSSKLKSLNQLVINYGIPVINDFNILKKVTILDKFGFWLTQENYCDNVHDATKLLDCNIRNITEEPIVLIYISSGNSELVDGLTAVNSNVVIIRDYESDLEQNKLLSKSDSVIIAATKFDNTLLQLERAIEFVKTYDKNFVGVILE